MPALERISSSRKDVVSEGIQTVGIETRGDPSDIKLLKEKNKTLEAENENLESKFQLYMTSNSALLEDVVGLNEFLKSKDAIINAWEEMGKTWEQEKSR